MGWSHQEEATEHKRVYITLVTPWYSLRVAEEIVEWGEMGGGRGLGVPVLDKQWSRTDNEN